MGARITEVFLNAGHDVTMIDIKPEFTERGKTVIVVTHEKDLVDYFKQRVVKISDGKVVSDGVGGMFN